MDVLFFSKKHIVAKHILAIWIEAGSNINGYDFKSGVDTKEKTYDIKLMLITGLVYSETVKDETAKGGYPAMVNAESRQDEILHLLGLINQRLEL